MKTAIYFENGKTQIVLTPENDWEKLVLKDIIPRTEVRVERGSFYECAGGWKRKGSEHESVMLILK